MAWRPGAVGQPIKRCEDPRLIRGLATYTGDVELPRMLHAAFVRSDFAAGSIRSIDTEEASRCSGVIAIFTGADIDGRVGTTPVGALMPDMNYRPHPLLAQDSVRYVGQPVAVVIAEDPSLARDAATRVWVDIEPRPVVVDVEAALAADAPRVYENFDSNVVFSLPQPHADTDRLFSEADTRVSLRLLNQRVAPVPMEGRAVVAHWEEGPGKLTVWVSTQTPHFVKQQVARCLGIPEIRVRAIAPEVGGGFGAKIPVYPEECLLSWVSRELRRPIKWSETRTENLANTSHGRGHVEQVEAAVRADGRVLALRGRTIAEVGAYCSYYGPFIALSTPSMAPGCYDIKAVSWETTAVYTNTMATDAYRGAGRPEAAYLIERIMDAVARVLELDPAEVRRRNFIARDAFPFTTATGSVYDSGDYNRALDEALRAFDYRGARKAQREARHCGRLVGIGIATFTEVCGLGPSAGAAPEGLMGTWESATVRVEPSGNVTVLTGISPHGQGEETAFAQMAADAFGIGIDDVSVMHGDTDVVQHGVGTFGSRGIAVGGVALHMALTEVHTKALRIAAHHLDMPEERVLFRRTETGDGEFFVAAQESGGDQERVLTFRDVAQRAHLWNVAVPGEEPGLEAVARFEPPGTTYPFGAHLCQVEIDPETGQVELQRYLAVDDFGEVINPLLADGQRIGGIVQGIGQALHEEVRYDENGQLLSGSLMDYSLPRACGLPRIELGQTVTPTPVNPLGAKGIGELGTIGATPCVMNAVLDALEPLGIHELDMPARPDRVWAAIRSAAREEGRR